MTRYVEKNDSFLNVLLDYLAHWRGFIAFAIAGALVFVAIGYLDVKKENLEYRTYEEQLLNGQYGSNITLDFNERENKEIQRLEDIKDGIKCYEEYKEFFSFSNFDCASVPTCEYIFDRM